MQIDPRLHHYSQQIVPESLEKVLEMYEILGCKVVYRPDGEFRWAMVGQEQLRFAIQIVETKSVPIESLELKRQTHIAFLSDNPQSVIDKIKVWAQSKSILIREGGWNNKELYFDLPEIFINFVVEVMHSSIEED